jgi:hypothetical protein
MTNGSLAPNVSSELGYVANDVKLANNEIRGSYRRLLLAKSRGNWAQLGRIQLSGFNYLKFLVTPMKILTTMTLKVSTMMLMMTIQMTKTTKNDSID